MTPLETNPAFAPTHWTLVLASRGESPAAEAALGELCQTYWGPVFHFLRQQGLSEDSARELTQEFFARLLARHGLDSVDPRRGRFRSFLLGAVKHFLADSRRYDRRLKRGGGSSPESLDAPGNPAMSPGLQVADPHAGTPDLQFDRAWALALMGRALEILEREFSAAGKSEQFETLRPWLVGETPELSQTAAAGRLGVSEGAVKVGIHRLRKRFREAIRAEIRQTVEESIAVDEELRYLVEVLSAG